MSGNYPKSSPEVYSVPRIRGVRRDLAIVNPVAEFHKCKIISDNWKVIDTHIKSQGLSVQAVTISTAADTNRAVSAPDFSAINIRISETAALFDYALSADISRFYSTLYTHVIPWALHGKLWSKSNLNTPIYNNSIGALLDKAVRKGNDNQTIGIPVGPDSSRIISEIVASSLDKILGNKLQATPYNAFRNVDDWYIGFDKIGDAETAIAVIAAACREMQLEIHPQKTKTRGPFSITEAVWPTELRRIRLDGSVAEQARAIENYFELALHYAHENSEQNVLDYAVKRTKSTQIKQKNWRLYETYLLKIARINSTSTPSIVQIFANYNFSSFDLDKARIKKFIVDSIAKFSPLSSHSEIAWALFLAKALRINLSETEVAPVTDIESAVCALILLDLRSRGLISGTINTSLWEQSVNAQGLFSNMWLLAYESQVKGWLPATSGDYTLTDPYFGVLRARGISFYDKSKNVRRIGTPPPTPFVPTSPPSQPFTISVATSFYAGSMLP